MVLTEQKVQKVQLWQKVQKAQKVQFLQKWGGVALLPPRSAVVHRHGEPAAVLHCGGAEVLVYSRDTDASFRRQFRPALSE